MAAMVMMILRICRLMAAQCDENGAFSLTADERNWAVDNHSQPD
jgi:hypothetical protein